MNIFKNMIDKIGKFMYGRYGFDQFGRDLIWLGLFLTLIASFTRNGLLAILSYIPIIYALYRVFSKDIDKRTKEYLHYHEMFQKAKVKLKNYKLLLIGSKTHKYFRCKNCRQIIRIPRGKGKVSISCPRCRNEFISKT